MDAFLQPLVRQWPDEFASTRLRPDRICQYLGAWLALLWKAEEPLRRLFVWIGEQDRRPLGFGQDHPVPDGDIVAPQTDRVNEDESGYARRHGGSELASEHATKRVSGQR